MLCRPHCWSSSNRKLAIHNSSGDRYDFVVHSAAKAQALLLFLLLPLAGCLGWGDMFAPKRFIVGDYFLTEGDTSGDLFLCLRGNDSSVTGQLHRIGWNQRYILYTDDNKPTEWNVIDAPEHRRFTIDDAQRAHDSRFDQIVICSRPEAWEKAKSHSN